MKLKVSSKKQRKIAGPAKDPATLLPDYIPVACDFTDELEHFCVLKETIIVSYWDSRGELQSIQAKILDVYTLNKSEFIKMETGTEIRLDRIFSLETVDHE